MALLKLPTIVFERTDINEAAFVENLQRTVSDDGLLMEYLQVTTVDRTRIVPIGGAICETVERQIRWRQILRWHVPVTVARIATIPSPIHDRHHWKCLESV